MFPPIIIGTIISTVATPIFAQTSPAVLCVPGQCIQGYSNTTIGAVLSASGAATDLHLLPGQYTSDTSPLLLHNLLTSASASLSPSSGFNGSLTNLPLNLALNPGIATFAGSLYAGQSGFSALPSSPFTNISTPLTARSLALASNIWIAITSGSSSKRLVIWDSIPDISQLPGSSSNTLSLLDIQSNACSPPCASSGVCSASGTCQCLPGFTGSSCESCAQGFFGPQCKPCPSGCTTCDQGITGTGQCIKPTAANAPSSCNCLNGVCGSNGQCTCNTGFTSASNGTACAACSPGFFLTTTGDCKVCQLGCTRCADLTGACIACKTGFTQNPSNPSQCIPPKSTTSTGTVCPDGSFSNGASCSTCSSTCGTCTGATSNDCILCAAGLYTLKGACVSADSNGVCQGSNLIADNNKKECDSCGAKCTSCKISNFNGASTVNQAQCTGCLPGFFLSNGACVSSCPAGAFVGQDNLTCQSCDSSCTTCSGTSNFCLTCATNKLASNGTCVSTCPSTTFSSSGSCLTCHPDCASCSGGSFNQCTSCSPNHPVLLNGRCLPVCSQSQYFDSTTSSCQPCDSTCSSCSGPGPSNCLACSGSTQVLRQGACVDGKCQENTTVVAGLGVCLSDLVSVPSASGTAAPLPTITGISTPTPAKRRGALEWWQILLLALGCAFIVLAVLWCCRRRHRRRQAGKNVYAASAYNPTSKSDWRWRLVRFGEKLFGHRRTRRVVMHEESETVRLTKLRAAEEARFPIVVGPDEEDMVKLIGEYQRASPPATPAVEGLREYYRSGRGVDERSLSDASDVSAPSIYSQMTGRPRKAPEPREPWRGGALTSRFSGSTVGMGGKRPGNGGNRLWI